MAVNIDDAVMDARSLSFRIESQMWAQPMRRALYLHTDVDLETGAIPGPGNISVDYHGPTSSQLATTANPQHTREMGAEFASAYPKIAGRLGMEGFGMRRSPRGAAAGRLRVSRRTRN